MNSNIFFTCGLCNDFHEFSQKQLINIVKLNPIYCQCGEPLYATKEDTLKIENNMKKKQNHQTITSLVKLFIITAGILAIFFIGPGSAAALICIFSLPLFKSLAKKNQVPLLSVVLIPIYKPGEKEIEAQY
ncbi:hypothetical protein [Aliivibrio fischeri]|uniref:hypothetical protein n=1 Tax=Aliivibrio fischeri TaxID=668 RepID=UPI00080E248D|nr:hypothetical protein [Aliivibrio fischeri]OCH49029.1 hypothetical protein A6E02_01650 [Aliivibrio fischeri]OED58159.1 hypothetical protein BEI47_01165 [Aliivibrio fischeri]